MPFATREIQELKENEGEQHNPMLQNMLRPPIFLLDDEKNRPQSLENPYDLP